MRKKSDALCKKGRKPRPAHTKPLNQPKKQIATCCEEWEKEVLKKGSLRKNQLLTEFIRRVAAGQPDFLEGRKGTKWGPSDRKILKTSRKRGGGTNTKEQGRSAGRTENTAL